MMTYFAGVKYEIFLIEACSPKCEKCSDSDNNCSACIASQHRTLSFKLSYYDCICQNGYFETNISLNCSRNKFTNKNKLYQLAILSVKNA